MSLLKLDDLSFSYDKIPVLENICFEFERGKIYAVVGKSGSGKTTLLSLLSGLVSPGSGKILYNDEDINSVNKYDFRRKYVGVIFQNYNLLSKLTAAENVVLSMDVSGADIKNKKSATLELLTKVGLSESEANRLVLKLSGGQQQRVAIARALSFNPEIILADEPTGSLDEETQTEIMQILHDLAESGKCVIVVTHSPEVAKHADYTYELNRN